MVPLCFLYFGDDLGMGSLCLLPMAWIGHLYFLCPAKNLLHIYLVWDHCQCSLELLWCFSSLYYVYEFSFKCGLLTLGVGIGCLAFWGCIRPVGHLVGLAACLGQTAHLGVYQDILGTFKMARKAIISLWASEFWGGSSPVISWEWFL